MNSLLKKCPLCNEYILEPKFITHIKDAHVKEIQERLNEIQERLNSLTHADKEKIFAADDSGRIISIEEYAVLRGKLNSGNEKKKYQNIKSSQKTESSNLFEKIAQIKEKPGFKNRRHNKIKCKFCNEYVDKDKLTEHNFFEHYDELVLELKRNANLLHSDAVKKKDENIPIAPEGELGNMAEAFKQAFNETRYGEKGMHHRHEWDGKFGSTPLHDDYSDESDSK